MNALGFGTGNNQAAAIIADAAYTAPAAYTPVAGQQTVTLVVNRVNGTYWGEVTFTVDSGMVLDDVVDLLNDELNDSVLNDFWIKTDGAHLVFTNAYDFQLDDSSTNVGVLGMTDVAVSTRISERGPSTYEAQAINSLFGDVLDTGGRRPDPAGGPQGVRAADPPGDPRPGPLRDARSDAVLDGAAGVPPRRGGALDPQPAHRSGDDGLRLLGA
jgi:hypothetical protein